MIITLLTDFGAADYFVGAMKGAILSVNPNVAIIDITHEIAAHDLETAAFTLVAAFDAFPSGTIHLVVVDPGVGSSRRPIVVDACGHFFVGPDNGVFSHIYQRAKDHRVFQLTNEEYFRLDVSATFHGRDVFAPVAAALTLGVSVESFGPKVADAVRLKLPAPIRLDQTHLEAAIINIDRFGNCVTNITREHLSDEALQKGITLLVNGREVSAFRRFYSEESGPQDRPFIIWGSAGFLEISINRSSAARFLDAQSGQKIFVNRQTRA